MSEGQEKPGIGILMKAAAIRIHVSHKCNPLSVALGTVAYNLLTFYVFDESIVNILKRATVLMGGGGEHPQTLPLFSGLPR